MDQKFFLGQKELPLRVPITPAKLVRALNVASRDGTLNFKVCTSSISDVYGVIEGTGKFARRRQIGRSLP